MKCTKLNIKFATSNSITMSIPQLPDPAKLSGTEKIDQNVINGRIFQQMGIKIMKAVSFIKREKKADQCPCGKERKRKCKRRLEGKVDLLEAD